MDQKRSSRNRITEEAVGLYIHIPFCKSKCLYCDFPSYAGKEELFRPYHHALLKEIRSRAREIPKSVSIDTVYIGGGTPGLLPGSLIEEMLSTIREVLPQEETVEITLEMNPENRSEGKFACYAQCGINRLSIGFQSLNDHILARIGRRHTSKEALQAFTMAREAGFSNISIDLILGLPGHCIESFHGEIEQAVALEPEHISLYLIELDKQTPLVTLLKKGIIHIPSEELMTQLYDAAADFLSGQNYRHYEISSFSRPRRESKHNMKYWTDRPFLGFGSSAHSYWQGSRFSNVTDPAHYIEKISRGGSAVDRMDPFQREKRASEALFTGLRLMRGVDLSVIGKRYGMDILQKYESEIDDLAESGLIVREGQNIRLAAKGIILSNEIFSRLI